MKREGCDSSSIAPYSLLYRFVSNAPSSLNKSTSTPLLLRRRTLVCLRLGPLLPHPHQPRLAPRLPQLPIRPFRPLRHLAPLDLTHRVRLPRIHDRHVFIHDTPILNVVLDVLFRRVELLGLAGFAREDDETGAVGL